MNRVQWLTRGLLLLFLASCDGPTLHSDYQTQDAPSRKDTSNQLEASQGEAAQPEAAKNSAYPPALLVLGQLYAAGGDFRWEKPALKIVATADCLASFRPRTNAIVLEEKAIGIARSFGKDSLTVLAAVLGHELAHFYQNQGSRHGETTNFLAYAHEENADYEKEKEADLNGVFTAFVAGYKGVKDILPDMLEEIYRTYGLNDKALSNYPPIETRKRTAVEVQRKADTLLHVFKAANYLTAAGEYEKALACFNYLLRFYDGAEALSNTGTLLALQSLRVGGKKATPFSYPLEIDIYSRLSEARAEPLTPEEESQRQALLQKAKDFFDQALEKMPDYRPAMINSICVDMMSGKGEEASDMADQYRRILGEDTEKLLKALSLLHTARDDQKERAAAMLEALLHSKDDQAKLLSRLNLYALRQEPLPASPASECLFGERQSYPGNLKPRDLRNLQSQPDGLLVSRTPDCELKWGNFHQMELFTIRQGSSVFSFLVIEDPKVPLAQDLSVGNKFELQQGIAFKPFLGRHTVWYSKACRLLLITSERGKILEGSIILEI
jgi:tetratricopeptide (TPR) repeat protein